MKETQDVDRAKESVEAITQQLEDLDAEFKTEANALEASIDPQFETLEKVSLKPKKTTIAVKFVALCWAPYWHDAQGQAKAAWE